MRLSILTLLVPLAASLLSTVSSATTTTSSSTTTTSSSTSLSTSTTATATTSPSHPSPSPSPPPASTPTQQPKGPNEIVVRYRCLKPGAILLDIPDQPTSASNPIRADFTGLSFEFGNFEQFFGTKLNHNSFSLQLLKNVGERSGAPIVVRLGGNSQDRAQYVRSLPVKANATRAIYIEDFSPRLSLTVNTTQATYSSDFFRSMRSISTSTHIKWIFGLNFALVPHDNVIQAAVDGSLILGPFLEAFSLGNEPGGYVRSGIRSAPYDIPDYLKEWNSVTDAIWENVPVKNATSMRFRAGEICCAWRTKDVIKAGLFSNSTNQQKIEYFSDHFYPQSDCKGSHKPLLTNLLSHNFNILSLEKRLQNSVNKTLEAGHGFALGETNSVACGGVDGVSDVFGTTLWMIDFALSAAVRNVNMLNFHSSSSAPYRFWSTDIADPTMNQVKPPYYALLFLAEAIGKGTSSIEDIPTGDDAIVVYALWSAPDVTTSRRTVDRFAVLNLAPQNLTNNPNPRRILLNLAIPNGANSSCPYPPHAVVRVLSAPNVYEQRHIVWNGFTLGNSTSGEMDKTMEEWTLMTDPGETDATVAACECGSYPVMMKPGQAALVIVNQ